LGSLKEDFIYVYSESCSACDVYSPILAKAMKETENEIYKMDYLNEENKSFLEQNNIYNVPTILVVKDGTIVNRFEGARDYSETIKIIQ